MYYDCICILVTGTPVYWVNETLKTLRSMTSITILLGNASKLVHTHKYWRYSNIPHLHTCVEWTVRASPQHIYLLNSGKDFHLSMTMHRSMWEKGHLGVFSCFSGTHFELVASNGNPSATFNDELIFDEYFVIYVSEIITAKIMSVRTRTWLSVPSSSFIRIRTLYRVNWQVVNCPFYSTF